MSFVKVNEKSARDQNICVAVRCRPLSRQEISGKQQSCVECFHDKKEVVITTDKSMSIFEQGKKRFTFDAVFGPESTQISVYKTVVAPLIEQVLLGYSCTVFAYGQTGTGKTFTMEGDRFAPQGGSHPNYTNWEHDPLTGIIPRAINQIFEHLENSAECNDFNVRVSFLEIYNEEMFDLLGGTTCKADADHHNSLAETNSNQQTKEGRPRMYEDTSRKGAVIISGLEEVHVKRRDQVYRILEKGSEKRQFAATQLNAHSSRSHTVFSVVVTMKESDVDGEDLLKTGKLYLVDLAGSENIGRSGAVDRRAREAGTINQSLLTLGRVINALTDKKSHVPYRESKLTRLLADSLGGRTKTCIIATVSPSSSWLEETLSTLEYANRAKRIKNKPELNQRTTQRGLIKTYSETIARLKADLQAARDKNGIFLSSASYNELTDTNSSQKLLIATLEANLEGARSEYSSLCELFNKQNQKIARQQKNLNRARDWLKGAKNDLMGLGEAISLLKRENSSKEYAIERYADKENSLISQLSRVVKAVELLIADSDVLHKKLESERGFINRFTNSVCSYEGVLNGSVGSCRKKFGDAAAVMGGLKNNFLENLKKIDNDYNLFNELLLLACDESNKNTAQLCENTKKLVAELKSDFDNISLENEGVTKRVTEKISNTALLMDKTHRLNAGVVKQLDILNGSLLKKNEAIRSSIQFDKIKTTQDEYNCLVSGFNMYLEEKKKEDSIMLDVIKSQKDECLNTIEGLLRREKAELIKKFQSEIDASFVKISGSMKNLVDEKFDPLLKKSLEQSKKSDERTSSFVEGVQTVFNRNAEVFQDAGKRVGEIVNQNINELQKFNEILFLKINKNNDKIKADEKSLKQVCVEFENGSKKSAQKCSSLHDKLSLETLNVCETFKENLVVVNDRIKKGVEGFCEEGKKNAEYHKKNVEGYNNVLLNCKEHVMINLEKNNKEFENMKNIISQKTNEKDKTPSRPNKNVLKENVVPEFLNLSATIKEYYKKHDASVQEASVLDEKLQGRRLFQVVDEMDSVNDVSEMPSANSTFSKTQQSCTDTMHEDFN